MTKDGAWRLGALGWCSKSNDCKWWQTKVCDKCFKQDRYEVEDGKRAGSGDRTDSE